MAAPAHAQIESDRPVRLEGIACAAGCSQMLASPVLDAEGRVVWGGEPGRPVSLILKIAIRPRRKRAPNAISDTDSLEGKSQPTTRLRVLP